eukprot:424935_1
MDDHQRVYEQYVQRFGYPPEYPRNLIQFSKTSCGTKMKFVDARNVIKRNQITASNTQPSPKIDIVTSSHKGSISESKPEPKTELPPQSDGNNSNPYLDNSLKENFISSNDAEAFIEQHQQVPIKSNIAKAYDLYQDKYGSRPTNPTKLVAFCKGNKMNVTYSECREYIVSQSNIKKETPITKLRPKTEPESPPKTEPKSPKSNDDEKQINDDRRAAPILCRVNFECTSETAKNEICDALKTFAQLQIDTPHPGVITYHFTCCDATKHPLKLEFTEVYYDEMVYWQHANHPAYSKSFFKAFKNENRKSRDFITVGSNLSDTVKRVNGQWGSIFPETDAGYLLNQNYLKTLDCADGTQIMLKWNIKSPQYYRGNKQNVEVIRGIMNKLAVHAQQSKAIIFHSHRLAPKAYPDQMETIGIWPSCDCVEAFWNTKEVEVIMTEFKKFIVANTKNWNRKLHVSCEVYGDKIDEEVYETIESVFDDIGVTKQIKTDIGYVLHPQAKYVMFN